MNALLQLQLNSKISFRSRIRPSTILFTLQQGIQLPPRMVLRTVSKHQKYNGVRQEKLVEDYAAKNKLYAYAFRYISLA